MIDISGLQRNCLRSNDDRKVISMKEGKVRYIAHNPHRKHLSHFRVDGCLIREGRKCDEMIVDANDDVCYLIELKGTDLKSAIEQINASLDHFSIKFGNIKFKGRIVVTRNSPAIRDNKEKKLRDRLAKFRGDLIVKNNELEETI